MATALGCPVEPEVNMTYARLSAWVNAWGEVVGWRATRCQSESRQMTTGT